jgi:ATP-dependent protease ClpP protease subunit
MNEINYRGFDITIENEIGSTRKGTDEFGKSWSTVMKNPYGFFNNTLGADGDEVDVFIGGEIEEDFQIYVINQSTGKPRKFDEHKVMFGFHNKEEAKAAYLDNYQDDWTGFDNLITFSLSDFKEWLKSNEMKKPAKKITNKVMKGNIKNILLEGEVETDGSLKNLMEQAGDKNSFETLVLEIISQGGCVEEGLKIMIWLDMLSQEGKEIITVVSGNAYSIASLIMLAADKRYISKHGEIMVHNPMIPYIEYANANELEKHIEELRSLEEMLQSLYVGFSNISIEDIKILMDNETFLSPEEAVSKGFADEVINIKPKPFSMMATKTKYNMSKSNVRNQLNVVIAALNGEKVVNQMYYNTKGDEIQIYQSNPAKYAKGDKTSMEAGEVRLSDGTMLNIKNFEIEDIVKELEPVAEDAIPEGEVAKDGDSAPVAETNAGPAPAEPLTKTDEEKAKMVKDEEDKAKMLKDEEDKTKMLKDEEDKTKMLKDEEDKTKMLKDEEDKAKMLEDEKAKAIGEPVAPVVPVEPVAAVDPVEPVAAVDPVEPVAPVAEEGDENHAKIMEEMAMAIKSLLEKVETLEQNSATQADDMTTATLAIDTLARSTSSAFKPEKREMAKRDDDSAPAGMSLFQKLRFEKAQRNKK